MVKSTLRELNGPTGTQDKGAQLNRQERMIAIAQLKIITSKARHLSNILPTLVSNEKRDQCVAEFEGLRYQFEELHGRLDREHHEPAWVRHKR